MTPRTQQRRRPPQRPLILVSNDDGVHAMGLKKMISELKKLGEVVAVAPERQRSAASHSITLHRPLRVARIQPNVYAVDGTPADCVLLAMHEILKKRPDLIVSGINHGANLGDDVHYSGTVSVAFEGGIIGIPSIAVSLAAPAKRHFAVAAKVGAMVAKRVLTQGLPTGIILNVNVPDLPAEKILGLTVTRQGKRNYGGIIVEKVDPRGRKYYWIGGDESGFEDIPESDCNAIREGKVSITPLRVNLTDESTRTRLESWSHLRRCW